MNELNCPECGSLITDEVIENALIYAHDCGFDEGYETAQIERESERQGETEVVCIE